MIMENYCSALTQCVGVELGNIYVIIGAAWGALYDRINISIQYIYFIVNVGTVVPYLVTGTTAETVGTSEEATTGTVTSSVTEFTSYATEFSTEIETEIVTIEEATTEVSTEGATEASSLPTSEGTTEEFTPGNKIITSLF